MTAEDCANDEVAVRRDTPRQTVSKRRRRFNEHRLDARGVDAGRPVAPLRHMVVQPRHEAEVEWCCSRS